MRKFIIIYVLLSATMLVFKLFGEATTTGNGADLIANLMGFILAQPWLLVLSDFSSDDQLITVWSLLIPVLINVGILLFSYWQSQSKNAA